MWIKTNIEGVYKQGCVYRLDPHVRIEISEGKVCIPTYNPNRVENEYIIQNDIAVYNDTNFKQFITSTGMVSPRSKTDITVYSIRQGKENERRYYADKT
tara:strand:- start:1303 stop:1599 length:297 start_codon:yes stop_codon:yes gene_type:complete